MWYKYKPTCVLVKMCMHQHVCKLYLADAVHRAGSHRQISNWSSLRCVAL